ncbi:uncharacterized protein At3g49140 isoform X1 [Glycine soja]|uniref:Uncharacterized protein n=1 Tax=Glycine soja TaxID=3848 RepID=A0A445H0W3_GLYSO|nr:uncharacterized protein At3g49140 isoform X1 [Glycine soja]RZB67243.1 hypothetical protein D0Y65_037566 [Glycine soja]
MAILPPASSFPSSSEGICCSTYGITSNSIKLPIDGRRWHDLASTRCKSPFFGSPHLLWLSTGHDLCLSKVNVAADYSDSIPDSSDQMDEQGYHPLEELKGSNDIQPARLSPAEIAKTTVEANKSALLVFPGMVHCEPHDQISWAEFQYHIDDVGDIYFEISDDANLLADCGANNPVVVKILRTPKCFASGNHVMGLSVKPLCTIFLNALIGMDIPIYDNNRRTASEYDIFNNGSDDEFKFDDDDIEVSEMEEFNIPVNWGQSDTTKSVHPIYFSKCLAKAINNMEYVKRMNHPSNGVSIIGFLRPVYGEEKSYLRWMYHTEDGDVYISDWRDFYSNSDDDDERDTNLTLYRLEILSIELHSMYGYQSEISVLDFQDAEPDILAHSSSEILERFNQFCDDEIKALCKKKGLYGEGAYLVGVDSLGVDVRVLSGAEVKTHRFPFKVQAANANAAEKQIWQLLFPRSRRKKNMKKWWSASMI